MKCCSEPRALNCYIFSRPIPQILSASRNLILTHFSLSRSLNYLLCDLIAPTPVLVFSLMMPLTLAAASSFSSGRAFLLSLSLSLSSLDPYFDYVGVNLSLNNSSSFSFLNVYARPIFSSLTDRKTDSFSPSIFSSSRNFFILGGSTTITPFGTQKVLPTLAGRKYLICVISSVLLPLNNPDIPTLLHCSFGSRSSSDIFFVSLALSCSWEMLRDLGSDHLPILLLSLSIRSFTPTNFPLPSTFRNLARMTLLLASTPTVLLQGILVSFSFLYCYSLHFSGTERGQNFHSFWPHQTLP